jgi:hypothetical protein
MLQLHATFDSPYDRPLSDIADKIKEAELVIVRQGRRGATQGP